jgi:tetratricopeptide (TPR) repeat protein
MRLLFVIILVGFNNVYTIAQSDKVKEYQLQQEQFRKTQLLREIDSGKYYMDMNEYALADAKFKYVLDNIKSVPSELTFFFGKNSYHLGKFKQSVDWLTKYIQLKGTSGQYYNEAVVVLQKAESDLINQRKTEASQIADVLSRNYDIDCGPGGKVVCPVCRGTTVVVKPGIFGNSYKTCSYCDKHGLLTCEEYNKLVRGELVEKQ